MPPRVARSTTLAALISLALVTTRGEAFGRADEPPIDEAQESALLHAAGAGFRIKRTARFVIAYNVDDSVVEGLLSRLTQTYNAAYRFCEANKIEVQHPASRLEVIFFDQRPEYDRYAARLRFPSAGTYGVYHQVTNRSAFVNMQSDPEWVEFGRQIAAAQEGLDKLASQMDHIKGHGTVVRLTLSDGRHIEGTKEQVQAAMSGEIEAARRDLHLREIHRKRFADRINQTVIQHETAHQVFFNCGVHVRLAANPSWLVEGLACLFETPPGQRGAGLGTVNQLRLRDFRTAVGEGPNRKSLKGSDFLAAINAGRFIKPRRLITDPELFALRGEAGGNLYAISWSLAHYLQRTRTAELAAYLKELTGRRPAVSASADEELKLFEKHFGPLDDGLIRRWGGYILDLTYRPAEAGL